MISKVFKVYENPVKKWFCVIKYVPNRARLPPPGVPLIAASLRMLRELGLNPASSCAGPFNIENGDLNRNRKSGDEVALAMWFEGLGAGVFEGVTWPIAMTFGGAVWAPRA